MNDKPLSDKERLLLEAARRDVESKRTRREGVDASGRAPSVPHRGSGAPREAPGAALSPALDAPTVFGWDHPAAQAAPKGAEDKWARVAALMDTERREADAKRRRLRRRGIAFLGLLVFIALIALVRTLIR